ncbi:MAG: YfhO family protein [Clostridia bacterium]|nr:YfhO family protein [Clostridia bacterium]
MDDILIPVNKKKNYGLKTFLLGLFFASLIFLPFIIYNNGYFLYYGDFNVQQVPFYQMIHDSIRSGKLFWSNTTDLGANIIGSYSFYMLGSPFFWLTLLFPSKAVPYLMGPLLILKFACASWAGYVYVNRYLKEKNYAVIAGLLYGFSGFSVYNVFFNHFHEAIIVFPLLLYAVDEFMFNKRRGLLAVTVFASSLMNYYFFCGQVVFVIIYFLLCLFCKDYKFKIKDFLSMAFECVIGLCMSGIILIPSIFAVMQNSRVNSFPEGYSALLYGNEQRYLHIIQSMFFPPDIPARPNFTPDSNAKWASVAAYLPLFGMCGVFGYLQLRKRDRLKKMICLLLLFSFVPLFNSTFQLLNTAYYARWFYMLTLLMSFATVKCFEEENVNWKRAITWSASITLGISLAIGLMPENIDNNSEEKLKIGLEKYSDRFWIYVAIALICIALTVVCVKIIKKDSKNTNRVIAILGAVSIFYASYILLLGSSHSYDTHNFVIPYALNNGEELELDDIQNVRSDFYESMDNMGMYWQIPTIQAFHSIVPGSVMEFYESVGVERSVGSRPETNYYGLRGITSCKYLFDCNYDDEFFVDLETEKAKMPGWANIGSFNGFKVYQNDYYIPYGFYFDTYITEENYNNCYKDNRHLLLLKALVLSSEDMVKYADTAESVGSYSLYDYNIASYYSDCKELKKHACSQFSYTKNGFEAQITIDDKRDRLVFFSVPYEDGWSAYVNGDSAEIVKVDIGFMAVRVPKGQTSSIVFKYTTPGLKLGAIVTIISVLLFIVYYLMVRKKNKLIFDIETINMRPMNDTSVLGESFDSDICELEDNGEQLTFDDFYIDNKNSKPDNGEFD